MSDRFDPGKLDKHLRSTARPPRDWRDAEGWDAYWTETIAERKGLARRLYPMMTAIWVARLVDRLRGRGRKRILFAGNGLSVGPWARGAPLTSFVATSLTQE